MTNDLGSAGAGRDGRLQELVEEWRARDAEHRASLKDTNIPLWHQGIWSTYSICADELAAILAVPDPLASDTGQGQISDREIERIRKFWNKPPAPTFCSACKKEIQAPSYCAAAGFSIDPPCPHCGARAGWTSTFTTGGRDAKDDINALLNRLAPLASSSELQGEKKKSTTTI